MNVYSKNQNIISPALLELNEVNAQSAIANKYNLEYLLEKENIDIALLSETWFKPSVYVNFNSFNTHRQDRADGKGGVVILLKNFIKYSVDTMTDNCDK
nr:unnamed protein product [Callosobruchus chinensis]